MTFNLTLLVALGIVTASAHWLVGRSSIARPLWSRATGVFDGLLRCAGCSGWWLGLAAGAVGLRPLSTGWGWIADITASGLLAVFLAPVFEGGLLWGLGMTAIPEDPESAQASPPDAQP